MNINFIEENGTLFAEVVADQVIIHDAQDALELLANCGYSGSDKIIVQEEHLALAFFDLKSGLAGDILQKLSNYRAFLAIIGNFSKYESRSFRDFNLRKQPIGQDLFCFRFGIG